MAAYDAPPRRDIIVDGVAYDGSLEAHWAEFLRVHGILARYHPPRRDFGNGIIYSPDFYLPELRTYAEVKRNPSGQDVTKWAFLAEQEYTGTVVLEPDGCFRIYEGPDPAWGGQGLRERGDCYLARCKSCGRYYFADVHGSGRCRACGYYRGRETADIIVFGDGERAMVANLRYYFACCSYAKDRGKPHHAAVIPPGQGGDLKEVV